MPESGELKSWEPVLHELKIILDLKKDLPGKELLELNTKFLYPALDAFIKKYGRERCEQSRIFQMLIGSNEHTNTNALDLPKNELESFVRSQLAQEIEKRKNK